MNLFQIYALRLLLGITVALSFLTFSGEAAPLEAVVTAQNGGDQQDSQKIVMPAMARKAGGSWRPELLNEKEGIGKEDHVKNKESAESWYEDDEEDEPKCPRRMYFHIRGKRCVPLRCPGGNKQRNKKTGECKLKDEENEYRPLSQRVWYGQHRGQFRRAPAVWGRSIYVKNSHKWSMKRG